MRCVVRERTLVHKGLVGYSGKVGIGTYEGWGFGGVEGFEIDRLCSE